MFVNLKDTVGGRRRSSRSGTRCARRSTIFARRCPPASSISSTMSSATPTRSFSLTSDVFTHRSCAMSPTGCARKFCGARRNKVDLVGVQDEKVYLEFSTPARARRAQRADAGAAGCERWCRAARSMRPRAHRGPRLGEVHLRGEPEGRISASTTASSGWVISPPSSAPLGPAQPMSPLQRPARDRPAISMTSGGDVLALARTSGARAQLARVLPAGVDLHLVRISRRSHEAVASSPRR